MGFISAPVDLSSPAAIGSTTPNTGSFTTLSATGNTTILNNSGNFIIGTTPSSQVGMLRSGGALALHIGNTSRVMEFNGVNATLPSFAVFGWNSTNLGTGTFDLNLARDASDILAQRRSTNAQTFRLYNTYTDASNYERGFFRWSTRDAKATAIPAWNRYGIHASVDYADLE
ncbi:MAG: hypothetical protein EBZ87_00270 [Microbacteriaceae bacterium]|nr:hypothetical protein [Microbacteriaceae bacterium]